MFVFELLCFYLEDGIGDALVAGLWRCVFFFQAEDGIRDDLVTGVQTCALPILLGATSKQLLACLGRPTSAAKRGAVQRWRWRKSIEVRLSKGRAFSITLRDKRFTDRKSVV